MSASTSITNKLFQHAFIVMRAQPLHIGHQHLLEHMFREAEYVSIILGSIQEERTQRNPFSFTERLQMLHNLYQPTAKLQIFGLPDIPNDNQWHDFVLDNIHKQQPNFPTVEAFYCGGNDEGKWFDDGKLTIKIIPRQQQTGNLLISATKIRNLMYHHNPLWQQYIPPQNLSLLQRLLPQIQPILKPTSL